MDTNCAVLAIWLAYDQVAQTGLLKGQEKKKKKQFHSESDD